MKRRMQLAPWIVLAACACVTIGCSPAGGHAAAAAELLILPAASLPSDPLDERWDTAPEYPAALILQDMVEPRLLLPSTLEVRVRAMSDGARIAFRLEWDDPTADDVTMAAQFPDACAVQLPVTIAADVPAPQMGETGRPVEITFWRASWQAMVDGRGDTIQDIFPNASVDHYPFEATSLPAGSDAQRDMAQRYAPARELGNAMAGPRDRPVQDLVASGPGTLAPAQSSDSNGCGKRLQGRWCVVISRRMPSGLTPGKRTQVALAIWQGAQQEAGSRKMRSVWIPMLLEVKP